MKIVHVFSLSHGKDSNALLIERIKRKEPIDYIITCDIMFNNNISGEHPLMAQWIPTAEKKIIELLRENGYIPKRKKVANGI